MLRPAYRLTIGDRIVDTTDEPRASTAVDLTVALGMGPPADAFVLSQGQVGGLEPARGDEVTVALGYADGRDLTVVMSGEVTDVEPGVETKRVVAHGAGAGLLRAFDDRTFEQVTAGEIVRELAALAGVDVERVEDGPTLPAYVVDGRRSAAVHIRDLATLSGADAYVTPRGRLVFEVFAGQRTTHPLRYAEHVLDVELLRRPPRAGTVEVWGESPGASRGDESWAWLTKDFGPRTGSAGSGDPVLLVERPAARTAEAAGLAARAVHRRIDEATVRGRVAIQGRPQVHLGDAVSLTDFPFDDLDGTYQVRDVTHRVSKRDGFMTEIGFHAIGGTPE